MRVIHIMTYEDNNNLTFRVMESLDECSSLQNGIILLEVVQCVKKICEKLMLWCQGQDIDEFHESINKKFPNMDSCDYIGTLNKFKKH